MSAAGSAKVLLDTFLDSAAESRVALCVDDDGFGRRIQRELHRVGIDFQVLDLRGHAVYESELRDELFGRASTRTLPAVFVDGKYFGDCNEGCKALRRGLFPVEATPAGRQKAAAAAALEAELASKATNAAAATKVSADASEQDAKGANLKVKLEEFIAMDSAARAALVGRVSKSALKKLEKGARAHQRRLEGAAARQAAEQAAVEQGRAQRAAAGLAPDGPASAAIAQMLEAEAAAREKVRALESTHAMPVHVELLKANSGPLMGQDKWLGGMASPCGRYVYGVPGTAKRVLQIEVATGAVEEIGPSYEGQFKWLRGVDVPAAVMGEEEFPSGACFALPSNASSVLKIDPATGTVSTFGGPFEGDWLWHGGALAADGCIYAIPCNAHHVLKIDVRNEKVSLIGGPWPKRQKWYGGILGCNGCIYGIPQSAAHVLKIDPVTQECTLLPRELPAGRWLWHGGTHTPDRKLLYAFPNHADQVLKINTETDEVTLIGNGDVIKSGRHRVPQDGRYKYLGGAYVPANNSVYCFPCDAERVLKISCDTDAVSVVGRELLQAPGTSWNGMNKWQNGFFSQRDGCVYAVPQRADGVLRVVPATPSNGLEEDFVEVLDCGEECRAFKEKFEGGVLSHQGDIYCIPLRAKHVLKVVPALPAGFDEAAEAAHVEAVEKGTESWGGNE